LVLRRSKIECHASFLVIGILVCHGIYHVLSFIWVGIIGLPPFVVETKVMRFFHFWFAWTLSLPVCLTALFVLSKYLGRRSSSSDG
jgi:membrane protein implicated in regulation of membrane protease activity